MSPSGKIAILTDSTNQRLMTASTFRRLMQSLLARTTSYLLTNSEARELLVSY
jgi:hypothetical protein